MGHSGGSLKDQKVKRNVDFGSQAHSEIQRGIRTMGEMLEAVPGHLVKKLATFFLMF